MDSHAELMSPADILDDLLTSHDVAVRQVIMLDDYILRLCKQTYTAALQERLTVSFQCMISISVAEGMKQMYKEYRLRKWREVQSLGRLVALLSQQPPEEGAGPGHVTITGYLRPHMHADHMMEVDSDDDDDDDEEEDNVDDMDDIDRAQELTDATNHTTSSDHMIPPAEVAPSGGRDESEEGVGYMLQQPTLEELAEEVNRGEQALPEEQQAGAGGDDGEGDGYGPQINMDIEMGDEGIGHLRFDRASSSWSTFQCEFHRNE